MEKINVAELLKDCPSGMELDCTMFDDVKLDYIKEDTDFPIKCFIGKENSPVSFNMYGEFNIHNKAKCVIFPKGKTTWEGFHRPFKDGDIVFYNDTIAIFKEWGDETLFKTYVTKYLCCDSLIDMNVPLFGKSVRKEIRFATEEEKQKLFQAIKDNGYKWNAETKTLEKLVEPKFKVGDRIRRKGSVFDYTITGVKSDKYELNGTVLYLSFCNEYKWELAPNKFNITILKPFESRVLVRNDEHQYWIPAFWGCKRADGYTTTFGWCKYCIPYNNDTKHLLGTTNDCNEYYKTWE